MYEDFNSVDSQPSGPQQNNGLAIASMVLGIIAIVLNCCSAWYGLVLAIVGLVLGIVSNKNYGRKGMATAGIVCSIVALVLTVLWIILFAGLGVFAGGAAGLNDLYNELLQDMQ